MSALAVETPERKKDHRHTVSVAVFNLGLSVREIHELALAFPAARLRELEWDAYPSHLRNLQVEGLYIRHHPYTSSLRPHTLVTSSFRPHTLVA